MKKRKRTAQEKIRAIQMLSGILVPVLVQILPYADRGTYRNVWEIAGELFRKPEWHLVYGIVGLMEVTAVLYLIRLVLLIRRKETGILYKLPAWLFFLDICIMMYMGQLYALLPAAYATFEFMYVRFQEETEEREEAWAQAKQKEQEQKKRRKQALYFPGKYPKELYQIVRRMWREQMPSQMLVILSEAFLAAVIYFVLSGYRMMESRYTMESSITGEGIYGLFRSLGVVMGACCLLMMTLMFSWFIREQKKEYRMLTILGMRRHTALRIFLLGVAGNAFAAVIPGMTVGCVCALVFRKQLLQAEEGGHLAGAADISLLAAAFLLYVLILLIALGLNQENILSLGENTDRNAEKREEKRPGFGCIAWIVAGGALFLAGTFWYSMREWAESMYIHLLSISGLFQLLAGGTALVIRAGKRRFDVRIFDRRPFQKQFWSNFWRLFFMSVLYFLMFAVFMPPFAASRIRQNVASMYPYDVVCMVYEEDLPKILKLGETCQAQILHFPMMRMTSIYGSDSQIMQRGSRTVKWPQGQHVAVSESTYEILRKEAGKPERNLQLQGEEMHIVYQQDLSVKAHTIDWDTTRMEDRLRFGQPLEFYNPDDYRRVFPSRNIVSEERDCLTGSFHQGMQENLIVLSDEYFTEVYEKIRSYNADHMDERRQITFSEWKAYTYTHPENLTEGPTELLCIRVQEQNRETFLKELSGLDKAYRFDQMWDRNIRPYYVKSEMVANMRSEISFTRIAYGFILVLLYVMAVFQYGVKIQMELPSWEWENRFLMRMGMKRKERRRKIRYQMRILMIVPLLSGALPGILFSVLTGRARLFTNVEMSQFLKNTAIVYGFFFLCSFFIYYFLQWYIWNKVEKSEKNN